MAKKKTKKTRSGHDDEVERLYRLPLDEFTIARNESSSKLKQAGDREAAEEIRALAKPSQSAWVVNFIYGRQRKAFERLIATGADMRAIQQAGGDPGELGQATRLRRNQIAALIDHAEAFGSGALAPAMRRRVETTLEAVATFGDAGPDQALGRMIEDVEPPGFEALLLFAVSKPTKKRTAKGRKSPAKKSPPRPTVDPRRIAKARLLIDKAKKDFGRKQAEEKRVADSHATLQERFEETRELERAAERGLRLARSRVGTTQKQLERAALAAARGAAVLARARKKLDDAQAALKKASKPPRRRPD